MPFALLVDVRHIHDQDSVRLRVDADHGTVREAGVDDLAEADVGLAGLDRSGPGRVGATADAGPPPLVDPLPACIEADGSE